MPSKDDAMLADIRKVRKETTAAGSIRFVAESDDEGHADRFWGLALAIHGAKSPSATGGFQGVEELNPERRRKGGGL